MILTTFCFSMIIRTSDIQAVHAVILVLLVSLVYFRVFPFKYLRDKNAELEEKFKDTDVPMPSYWWALWNDMPYCAKENY